jgi:peptide/nickel transport system permease protein
MVQAHHSISPSMLAWKKFKRNIIGMIALYFIAVSTLAAIAAYLIAPDNTPNANKQILEIATQKPGFSVTLLSPSVGDRPEHKGITHQLLFGKPDRRQSIPVGSIHLAGDSLHAQLFDQEGGVETVSFHLVHLVYPEATGINTLNGSYSFSTMPGSNETITKEELSETIHKQLINKKTYWLGTDQSGRDMLSRLILGTRVSLSVGFISVLISLIIGITIGSIGGYFGGRTDDFIVWLINVVWSLPTLLLVIAITFALGKGFWQVFIAVGLTMWVEVARIVRGQIIPLREKEFIEAGKALGYRNFRIILRHVVPNILSPVIVISAANFASAILIEAGLSFLGLGVQPPVPSWGSMIKENYAYIILDSAYLAIMPGLAIMLMVMAFMLVGNALRDALDVRLQGSEE